MKKYSNRLNLLKYSALSVFLYPCGCLEVQALKIVLNGDFRAFFVGIIKKTLLYV